jgi:hypothetical protein
MFLTRNLKGIESTHCGEPTYNRLYDRWDSICKIEMPRGTFKILGISFLEPLDVVSFEVDSYSDNRAVIKNINKINF